MAAAEAMAAPGSHGFDGDAGQEHGDGTFQSFLAGTGLDSHIINARPKPQLSEDERLYKEVARRRQVEMERRTRIFDAKRRTIGLDVEALDQQRLEKQQRLQQERAEARAYDNSTLNRDVRLLANEQLKARREAEKESREYSLKHLNFESRREFDLNDPNAHRKAPPTRVGDNDPRLGPASMQRFSGEDLTKEERKRQQQLETVNFIEQQKFEKAMLSKAEGEEMKAFAKEVGDITTLRNGMEANEANLRRDLQKTQQDSNLFLAAEKQRQKKLDAQEEMERNAAELAFHESDPFLNEKGRVRRGAPGADGSGGADGQAEGGGHVVGFGVKGSTRAQRIQVAKEQLEQADDDDSKKDVDKLDDHIFARQQESTRKQMIAMEREKARMKRAMAEQVARENKGLHQQQKAQTKVMDQVFTNEFRPEFFEQFGTSTR